MADLIIGLVDLLTPIMDVSLDASISEATLSIYADNKFDKGAKDFATSGLVIAIATTIGVLWINFYRTKKLELVDITEGLYGVCCVGMNTAILYVLSEAYTTGKDGEWEKISPMFTDIALGMTFMCISYIIALVTAIYKRTDYLIIQALCYSIDLVFMFSQILLFAILLVTMYNCMDEAGDSGSYSYADDGGSYGYGYTYGGSHDATGQAGGLSVGALSEVEGDELDVEFGCKNGTEGEAASAISSAAAVVGFITKIVIPVGIKLYEYRNKKNEEGEEARNAGESAAPKEGKELAMKDTA